MLDKSDPRRIGQREMQARATETQYLDQLPQRETLRLISEGEHRQLAKGTILVAEGCQIQEVYLIHKGLATVGLYESLDPALWLYVCGPKSLVDPCALLDPPESPVTVRALTDIDAVALPREALLQLVHREPAVGYQIMRALASRLSLINRVVLKEAGLEYPGPSRN